MLRTLVNIQSAFIVFVLKLSLCLASEACNSDFEIKSEHLNKHLVPYTFVEKVVASHHDCVRECFNFGGECKAVNFNMKNKRCELKSKGSGDNIDASEFEHTAGYIFIDIADWPKKSWSGCANHDCLKNQKCFSLGNVAYKCIDKANCGPPPTLEHSTTSAPVTTDGAFATYSCDYGYENTGNTKTKKCADGTWTEEAIVCHPKDCGALDDILFGTVTAPVTTHGGIASYSCNHGYEQVTGDSTRSCDDGTWSGIELSCAVKDCGALTDILYGTVTAPLTTHGNTGSYTCNIGYEIITGDPTRTCDDGTWSGIEPSCAIKDCGALADILYGTITAPVTTHGGVASYSCSIGYGQVTGDSTRTCNDGTWTGVEPSCAIKDCGPLVGISYGTVSAPVTTHGATATYTCYTDCQLTAGNSQRTCYDGTWGGVQAVCTPIRCPSICTRYLVAVNKEINLITNLKTGEYKGYCGTSDIFINTSDYRIIIDSRHEKTYLVRLRPAWIQMSMRIRAVSSGTTMFAIRPYKYYRNLKRAAWFLMILLGCAGSSVSMLVANALAHIGCYVNGLAQSYEGTLQYTETGNYCQRWDAQSPHEHVWTDPNRYPYGSISGSENYCRDPDFIGKPWCFTINSAIRWEYCAIEMC